MGRPRVDSTGWRGAFGFFSGLGAARFARSRTARKARAPGADHGPAARAFRIFQGAARGFACGKGSRRGGTMAVVSPARALAEQISRKLKSAGHQAYLV